MLSHEAVWAAIDALAARHNLSPSGLARKSSLDPTSFNKSKRCTAEGRQRWPSTESIAKALRATGTSLDEFMALVQQVSGGQPAPARPVTDSYRTPARSVPLLGFAQAGVGGFFDDGGFPAGQGWDEIPFPMAKTEGVYALRVTGDSMMPLYRDGDIIIVDRSVKLSNGRVIVAVLNGELLVRRFHKNFTSSFLVADNPRYPSINLAEFTDFRIWGVVTYAIGAF